MKIEVFLRQSFNTEGKSVSNNIRPHWFKKQKAFNNFKSTINLKLANYTIVYDEFLGPINKTFLSNESKVKIIKAGTEEKSFSKTLEIVESEHFDDNTIIYFIEDDYIHRENWCEVLLEAFMLPIHYVSLYDNLDKYLHYNDLKTTIYHTESVHWRTVPSTCNSYASKMKQLKEDITIHKHFSSDSDCGVSRDHQKFLYLGNSGKVLITPIPGYSTHCNEYMSPTIDWSKLSLCGDSQI